MITGSGGTLNCLCGPYTKSVFTSQNDNSLGEKLSWSTGNPSANFCGAPAIEFDASTGANPANFHDVRIAYAQTAVQFSGGTGHTVSHLQIVKSSVAFEMYYNETLLRNCLVYGVDKLFSGYAGTGRVEHLTIDSANWLATTNAPAHALYLTN